MKRVYIAGPMTGLPAHNFPAFRHAAMLLREAGYEVMSPVEINNEESCSAKPWQECMRADIAALVTCDMVALLPGWENSRGATLEHYIANSVGIPCRDAHILIATGPQ